MVCRPIASLDRLCAENEEQNGSRVYSKRSIESLQDCALVQRNDYEELFGKKSFSQKNYWKGNIVKITFGTRSIYRRLDISTTKGHTKGVIGLTYSSLGELSCFPNLDEPGNSEVTVTKGCRFMYWWRHPNQAARISAVLGFVSIMLSMIGIILSVVL